MYEQLIYYTLETVTYNLL